MRLSTVAGASPAAMRWWRAAQMHMARFPLWGNNIGTCTPGNELTIAYATTGKACTGIRKYSEFSPADRHWI